MRRVLGILLLPALALVALAAWMFASPIGAAADDDYHLATTWCGSPWGGLCEPGETSRVRVVTEGLAGISCYAQEPRESAACQEPLLASDETVVSKRGNWKGAYPPVYYAAMSVFAGPDLQVSALVMRFATIVLFLGITIALYRLLPPGRRPALLWAWLIGSLPLGVFLLGSNNPSSWSVIGVVSAFFALLGYFEREGRARIALGALFAVSVVMAAGSRGDAAIYAGFAIFVVLLLKVTRSRAFLLASILPVAMGLVAFAFFLTSRQIDSGVAGFTGGAAVSGPTGDGTGVETEQLTGFALFAYNLLNIPFLWSGVFGTWGLGWLDTSMPWVVPLTAIAVFAAVGFAGLARKDLRGAVVVLLTVVVLWALPLYVLQAGNDMVGDQVQPRYLFPLIVLLGALAVLTPAGRELRFGRIQALLVAAALAGVNLIALHMNIRRYVTGVDGAGPNLDAGAEWWWVLPVGPTAVWLLGSAAFAALVFLLVPRLAAGRELTGLPVLRGQASATARPITR